MKLLYVLLLSPFIVSAQKYEHPVEEVYNVYRRDLQQIKSYNSEYLKSIKGVENYVEYRDSITADIPYIYLNSSCFGKLKVLIHVILECKDSRTKITYSRFTYTHNGSSECAKNGNYYELTECKDCIIVIQKIKEDFHNYIKKSFKPYHQYLADKSKDGNW
jgi:hypothetical protein